ncbi:hypothetical protein QVD17_11899 [Tagetes erecta]|uniref:Uncharacterized protein n=1 Tax=Tagetes erecta TaxID=13708 RepID=A0AAD8KW06_TARER|nr:hypothetical protein QVD17_11899 [Tagetes erecta]
MANVDALISEISTAIPDATVWESEITTSMPASRVFHGFVLKYIEYFAETVFPAEFSAEVVTIDGIDAGLGGDAVNSTVKEIRSWGMAPARWTAIVDLENFACAYVYGGNVLYVEQLKVIQVDGGCIVKYKKTDTNTAVTEDEITGQKAILVQIFNAFEAAVAQDSNCHCDIKSLFTLIIRTWFH